jgi:hypothetical protein
MPPPRVNSGTAIFRWSTPRDGWTPICHKIELLIWRGVASDEFPDHDLEGPCRIPWRIPSACGSSARCRHSDFQRTGLDGSNEAHRRARGRPGHLQPNPGRPGRGGLADHGSWASTAGFDRGERVNRSRTDPDRRGGIVAAFRRAIGSAGRDQPAPISAPASFCQKTGSDAGGLEASSSAKAPV